MQVKVFKTLDDAFVEIGANIENNVRTYQEIMKRNHFSLSTESDNDHEEEVVWEGLGGGLEFTPMFGLFSHFSGYCFQMIQLPGMPQFSLDYDSLSIMAQDIRRVSSAQEQQLKGTSVNPLLYTTEEKLRPSIKENLGMAVFGVYHYIKQSERGLIDLPKGVWTMGKIIISSNTSRGLKAKERAEVESTYNS